MKLTVVANFSSTTFYADRQTAQRGVIKKIVFLHTNRSFTKSFFLLTSLFDIS